MVTEEIDYDQMYEFVEPHMTGGTSYVQLTAREAIEYMKLLHGNTFSDQDHLDSFIAIHWAYKITGCR